jgi:hypothetical protein
LNSKEYISYFKEELPIEMFDIVKGVTSERYLTESIQSRLDNILARVNELCPDFNPKDPVNGVEEQVLAIYDQV